MSKTVKGRSQAAQERHEAKKARYVPVTRVVTSPKGAAQMAAMMGAPVQPPMRVCEGPGYMGECPVLGLFGTMPMAEMTPIAAYDNEAFLCPACTAKQAEYDAEALAEMALTTPQPDLPTTEPIDLTRYADRPMAAACGATFRHDGHVFLDDAAADEGETRYTKHVCDGVPQPTRKSDYTLRA